MKPISLYNLKSTAAGWLMTKFNEDLEPQASYAMHYVDQVLHCSCPAMARHTCRHREMFVEFVARDRINTTWFLVQNDNSWRQFVGPFEQIAPDHEAPVFDAEGEDIKTDLEQHLEAHPELDPCYQSPVTASQETLGEGSGSLPVAPSPSTIGVRRRI